MKVSISTHPTQNELKICQIIGVYDNGELTPTANAIDKATKGTIRSLIKQGIITGKLGASLPLFNQSPYASILIIGCGKQSKLTSYQFRKIISASIKATASHHISEAISYLTELEVDTFSLAWKVKQMTEISAETLYRFDQFKTDKESSHTLKSLIVAINSPKQLKGCDRALKQGLAIAESVTYTKNLANMPSNICTPTYLANEAKALSKDYKTIKVNVLGEPEMKKLGMGAILGVSQGSAQESKFIILHYQGTRKEKAPTALIGKGITFDTGGNSLKSPDKMVGMKYDMCGAATVLGTIKAAATLKLPVNIIGLIPAVENMPGGTGYKPEDILTSLSGQTIEVISTDAEGRLILADALTYCERFKPDAVIDIATLTGAVVIALGFHTTAVLSNNDALVEDLLKASKESTDKTWQLPLFEEYQEQINSPFADIANTGGGSAGTITAACFLSRFAKKFRWAHLDVAGTAAIMGGTSERRATGRPVPLLVQYLIDRAQ